MSKLTDLSYVKSVLAKHGFTFSKALGQNFLINPSVCPRMAEECGCGDSVGVIEIGPGAGVLTNELAKVAYKVVAIELDKRLLPVLDETLEEFDNVKIINADVLKTDLHKLIEEEFQGLDVIVCSNLPYYITSPVIMKLLEEKLPIKSITVMVQKEAADRLCADLGTRQTGAVTVAVNYYAKAEMLFKVSSGSFMPPPKVDSAVIKLDVYGKPAVETNSEEMLFKVIKAAFAQRRKTLLNTLSNSMQYVKSDISEVLNNAKISQNARAEQLKLEDFAAIANELSKLEK